MIISKQINEYLIERWYNPHTASETPLNKWSFEAFGMYHGRPKAMFVERFKELLKAHL